MQILDTIDCTIQKHRVRVTPSFEVNAMLFAPKCIVVAASDPDRIMLIDVERGTLAL